MRECLFYEISAMCNIVSARSFWRVDYIEFVAIIFMFVLGAFACNSLKDVLYRYSLAELIEFFSRGIFFALDFIFAPTL